MNIINKTIADLLPHIPQKLVWQFSKEYIAGETVSDAMRVSREMNASGIKVTIDILGEFISTLAEAEKNKQEYLDLMDDAEKENIDGNYSIKPTMFGLLLDREVCCSHIREIVRKAASQGNFIRIDMEDSPCVDAEIEIYRRMYREFPGHVGLVLQSYLKRTWEDLRSMLHWNREDHSLNYRLCKGIYVEPEEIAFKKYEQINRNYLRCLEFMFRNDLYVGIATHDKPLVDGAYKLIEKYGVAKDRYEFQMLYGVTPDLRKSIVEKGHTMRVYVPYGKQWFGYSTRRLKENPQMANHIIKALFNKG